MGTFGNLTHDDEIFTPVLSFFNLVSASAFLLSITYAMETFITPRYVKNTFCNALLSIYISRTAADIYIRLR